MAASADKVECEAERDSWRGKNGAAVGTRVLVSQRGRNGFAVGTKVECLAW